jgi:hypothetical protein
MEIEIVGEQKEYTLMKVKNKGRQEKYLLH